MDKTCGECKFEVESLGVQCNKCKVWYHYSCINCNLFHIFLMEMKELKHYSCVPCMHDKYADYTKDLASLKKNLQDQKSEIVELKISASDVPENTEKTATVEKGEESDRSNTCKSDTNSQNKGSKSTGEAKKSQKKVRLLQCRRRLLKMNILSSKLKYAAS